MLKELVKAAKIISSWIGTIALQVGVVLPIIGDYTIEQTTSIDLLKGIMLINLDFVVKHS